MCVPKIDTYQFGQIIIDGQKYTNDLIIFPDKISSNWWRVQGHSLSVEDLQEVLTSPPQVLIIGTGAYGQMKVPQKTISMIQEKIPKMYILDSVAACKQFNEIREVVNAVLAIHLTC